MKLYTWLGVAINLQEDATLAGYEAHLRAENAPPPMTNTERELAEVSTTARLHDFKQFYKAYSSVNA